MVRLYAPINVSIQFMDKERLAETRREYRPLLWEARRQFWKLWLINRSLYVLVLISYLVLAGVALRTLELWIGDLKEMSGWGVLLTATPVVWLVTWVFISNAPLNAYLEKSRKDEHEVGDVLRMHLHTLGAIRNRELALAKQAA